MARRRLVAFGLLTAVFAAVSCSGGSDTAGPNQSTAAGTPPSASTPGESTTGTSSGASGPDALPRLIVGTGIMPGLNIATDLATCYYARLPTVDAVPDDALGQSNALGMQVFLTVEPTDAAVISVGCGDWRIATDADMVPTPDGGIPDTGMWLVPEQIKPGTYQTVDDDPNASCFYQTLADLSGSLDAVLETQQGLSGQVTMTIGDDVRAVRTYRCGAWKKVSG